MGTHTHTHTEIMVAIKKKGPRRNGVGFKRVSEHGVRRLVKPQSSSP